MGPLLRNFGTQPKKLAEQLTVPRQERKQAYENPVGEFWKLKIDQLKRITQVAPKEEVKEPS